MAKEVLQGRFDFEGDQLEIQPESKAAHVTLDGTAVILPISGNVNEEINFRMASMEEFSRRLSAGNDLAYPFYHEQINELMKLFPLQESEHYRKS